MKRKSVTTIRHLLEKQGVIFLRLGSLVRGALGVSKTAIPRKNGKNRNTASKIDEIPKLHSEMLYC